MRDTVTNGMQPTQRTETLTLPIGPLVVDIWDPPAGTATAAPPLLLIHGWGGSGSYWADTARALAARTRVYVPDLPGTGRSQPVARAQNMFDQVATLEAMLDAFDLDHLDVIGHSMGGAMALLLTDARPNRVRRLILTSLSFFLNDTQEQIYRAVMKAFSLTLPFRRTWLADLTPLSRMMARRYFYRLPDDPALLHRGFVDYLTLDAATARACADDAPTSAIPEAGSRIQVPTLLIACRQDQVMPVENVDYTVETIPNCQLRWIDKCGHLPMVEQPVIYLDIVEDFLYSAVPPAGEPAAAFETV